MKDYLQRKVVLGGAVLILVVLMLAGSFDLSLAGGSSGCGGWLYYGYTVYETVPARGYVCSYTFSGAAGNNVEIKMIKRSNSLDPYLALYDPYGYLVAYDDDSARNANSRITYQLYYTGTYKIVAQGYNRQSSGPFMLTLTLLN